MREEIRLYDGKHLVSSQSDLVQIMGPLLDGSVFTTVFCDDVNVQAIKFPKVPTCILQLPTPTWIMDELEGRTFRPSYLHSLRKLLREKRIGNLLVTCQWELKGSRFQPTANRAFILE